MIPKPAWGLLPVTDFPLVDMPRILSAASSKHPVIVFHAPLVMIALGFPLIVTKKSDVITYKHRPLRSGTELIDLNQVENRVWVLINRQWLKIETSMCFKPRQG